MLERIKNELLKRNCIDKCILNMTVQHIFSSESNEIIIQTKEV